MSACHKNEFCALPDDHAGECEEFDPQDYAMDGGWIDVASFDPDGDR